MIDSWLILSKIFALILLGDAISVMMPMMRCADINGDARGYRRTLRKIPPYANIAIAVGALLSGNVMVTLQLCAVAVVVQMLYR